MMSTIVKNLGAATAYAYAKQKGYTGTEEEFAELMASYAYVAESAAESAEAAAGSASDAAESAALATTKAGDASASSNAAAASATSASTKADEASASATSASDSASIASSKAGEAVASATAAAGSATTAGTKATEAAGSAADAATAKTAAQTAQSAAETAQAAAETAQGEAEEAAESVSESVTQIATNTQDISELKSALDDLSDDVAEFTEALADKADKADLDALEGTVGELSDDVDGLTEALADKASAIVDTASGAIASFPDGAAVPAKDVTIGIEPVQDLHGYDSPWPAGGGKNKIGFNDVSAIASGTNKTLTVTNGLIRLQATGNVSATSLITATAMSEASLVSSLPAGTYTFSVSSLTSSFQTLTESNVKLVLADNTEVVSGNSFTLAEETGISAISCTTSLTYSSGSYVQFYCQIESGFTATTYSPYSNICPISGWTGANVTRTGKNLLRNQTGARTSSSIYIGQTNETTFPTFVKKGVTYTLSFTADGTTLQGYYKESGGSNITIGGSGASFTPSKDMYIQMWVFATGLTQVSNFQLEVGETATPYEPYVDYTTYPISWQSEAGTVYGGTLDVTTGVLTVTYGYIASYNGESLPGRWISSMDAYSAGSTPTTDAQVVYELATPQTYQLTPVEIEMLLGDNNVWADTGDSTVTYRADTKLYIQKINAPTDDDMIADAQIASGKYFIVGGNLYKSTTTIPAGDTITPGTNCILTNLADALNALNT